ncbi:MAG: DUF1653 domain-containing protein [Firmicutes bacterium]|nr:DUF1653 domain-containing protein [Bacillota bacterium]
MERTIEIGKVYKHFKGHIYKVINIAIDSEDLSKKVVYQNIDDGKVWVRDYEMFNSLMDKEKYPNIDQKYRFEEVNE